MDIIILRISKKYKPKFNTKLQHESRVKSNDSIMKISGFTFVKNAIKYGYPVVESIKSILPIVDEMVVCLGDSEDETDKLVSSIQSDKIKIIPSVWDKDLREGGRVLAVETNKALDATAADADWLFYIQADEAVHEKYHDTIIDAMRKYKDDNRVDGLLFHYLHFYGSYRFIGDGRRWYSREIRVIKNNKSIKNNKYILSGFKSVF